MNPTPHHPEAVLALQARAAQLQALLLSMAGERLQAFDRMPAADRERMTRLAFEFASEIRGISTQLPGSMAPMPSRQAVMR